MSIVLRGARYLGKDDVHRVQVSIGQHYQCLLGVDGILLLPPSMDAM